MARTGYNGESGWGHGGGGRGARKRRASYKRRKEEEAENDAFLDELVAYERERLEAMWGRQEKKR